MNNFFKLSLSLIGAFALQAAWAQNEVPVPPPSSPSSPPPPPAASDPSTQMTYEQFQQWLKTNASAQKSAPQPVPPTSPVAGATPPPADIPPPPTVVKSPLTYEQSQQVMMETLPASTTPPSQESSIAFNTLLQQNMPLSPQQVLQLRQQIDRAQRAAATQPVIPPKPVSTTIMVNLAPGTTPPAVRLAQGYVSSLVFVDSTGTPWPIAGFDIGTPKALNIQWDGKSNILLLQAVSPYSDGNMVVRLVGLPTPITLELVAGQRVVDYRVDIHVSGIGPNTKDVPMGTALPNSASQLLLGVLDGVAPAGAKLLNVHGADAQAWQLGDKMYLRTRLTLLSPGWMSTMTSPDGMHAYELPKTSTVLVSRYGEPAELKIEGF